LDGRVNELVAAALCPGATRDTPEACDTPVFLSAEVLHRLWIDPLKSPEIR